VRKLALRGSKGEARCVLRLQERALLPGCGVERVQMLQCGPQLFAMVFGEGLAGWCAALHRIVREACGGQEGTIA
jgi:hypothetical protein